MKKLQGTIFGPVTFPLASITEARLKRIIDLDRKPQSTESFLEEEPKEESKEIMRIATTSFKTEATNLIAFAKDHLISLSSVLEAMLAAASDNSAADRVFAGTAYAIAEEANHPLSSDLLSGNIKLDALSPAAWEKFTNVSRALYSAFANTSGEKGDTIYIPTSLDIDNLMDRSIIIHELQHAQEDKAASLTSPQIVAKEDAEYRAWRAQARYILEQIANSGLVQVLPRQFASSNEDEDYMFVLYFSLVLEAQLDQKRYQPILEIMFGAMKDKFLHQDAQGVTSLLAKDPLDLQEQVRKQIRLLYEIKPGPGEKGKFEGLSGESLTF